MSATSTNYWLGGYWTGGKARGLTWRRGQWTNGELLKGQWHSNTLDLEWDKADSNRNKWSYWKGGTWQSNSQNNYKSNDLKLDTEYSIWHGGTWQSDPQDSATYTWQGSNSSGIDVYGDVKVYNADNVNIDTIRSILLPKARSLFLGGQWLRGVWEGGIFANGIWHSLAYPNITTEPLDSYHTISVNDSITLHNESETLLLDYTTESDYDEENSEFRSGAFVNSVWEGGKVIDTSDDPYNTMFGMSLSQSNMRIIFDDGGIQSSNGFLETTDIDTTRYYGIEMPNWPTYMSTNSILTKQSTNDTFRYVFPDILTDSDFYSVIWKRGKFEHGTFNYGQFHNYDATNNIITDYITDDNIHDALTADFSGYNSIFKKGLFYKSLFYGGTFLAQYSNPDEQLKSVFNRSIWMTGYWATHTTEYYTGDDGVILPIDSYTDDRYVTNARLWKSVWLSGIWEGGSAIMSAWNCLNPFYYNITINNETFEPGLDTFNDDELHNIKTNPLGKISSFEYYVEDDDGDDIDELYQEFKNVLLDFNRTDLLNAISPDTLTDVNLVADSPNYFMYYFDDDENGFPPGPPTPYDVVLYNDDAINSILYDFNNEAVSVAIDLKTIPEQESPGTLSTPNSSDTEYFTTVFSESTGWTTATGDGNNTTVYIKADTNASFEIDVSQPNSTDNSYILDFEAFGTTGSGGSIDITINGVTTNETVPNGWNLYHYTFNVANTNSFNISILASNCAIEDIKLYKNYTNCTAPITNPLILICPNNGSIPISSAVDYSSVVEIEGEEIGLGLVLYHPTEASLNSDVINENIFRTLGQVHNLLSTWQNGTFEGGVWNGGLWIKGEFKPYKFENYPINVTDKIGSGALLDYFDDNVADDSVLQTVDAIWARGIWYGGYLRADAIFAAVPAYILDAETSVNLNYKLCISDDTVSDEFSVYDGDNKQLKSLNLVSIFTRKSIRGDNITSNFLWSLMNGQFISGTFQDRSRMDNDMSTVPLIGTIIDEFSDDSSYSNGVRVSKFTFGNKKVEEVRNTNTLISGSLSDDYIRMKNTASNDKTYISFGEPTIYNPIAEIYSTDIYTGENISDKFYYEYYLNTIGLLPHPLDRVKIYHAEIDGSQKEWSDIYPDSETVDRIPSYTQGNAERSEPYNKNT